MRAVASKTGDETVRPPPFDRGNAELTSDDAHRADWKATRIGGLVDAITSRFERRAQRKSVAIVTLPGRDGEATIDCGLFALALYALLEEALGSALTGGAIEVRYEVCEVNLYVSVSGDALSVDDSSDDQVVAFTQDVIDAQGGELRVYRDPNRGVHRSMVLPVNP